MSEHNPSHGPIVSHDETGHDDIHPLARYFLWLDSAKVKKNFIWISVIGLVVTAAMMVLFPNKHPAPWEVGALQFVSYGVTGFVAYSFVVFSAKPLFKWLSRDENYYGEEDENA